MNRTRGLAVALTCLCLQAPSAFADETATPKTTVTTTATRPAKETTGQSSLPNTAPPATATQPTASTNQDATTKKMNEDEKKKVETEGK